MEHLTPIFTVAHTDLRQAPFSNRERTLRVVVECNVAANAFSVVFSNACGETPVVVGAATLALCDEDGKLVHGTLVPLTVGGALNFSLLPGEEKTSDRTPFSVQAGEHIALSLYYPEDAPVTSGNWTGNHAHRSRTGNYSADISMPGLGLASRFARTIIPSDMTVQVTTVAAILAHCDTPTAAVACFGDSITQQCTWTVPLEKRLHRTWPGQVSLCNLGISGNRLLRDGPPAMPAFGEAGIRRFERDVLRLPGLTHVVIELGTNDLGQPGTYGIPGNEIIDLEAYIETMEGLAAMVHERGAMAYAATLPPRVVNATFNHAREAARHRMNDWLRTAACFDAVLDFDAVLRRKDGEPGMKPEYVLPDGLHPTIYGGLWIAKSIDLSLFAPGGTANA